MTRVAAVDCGTNTVKLLVADLDPVTGDEVELVRESRLVRLGQGVDGSGVLAEEALARVLAAVDDYARAVRAHGAERVRFCATSATRDAANAEVFLRGVHERLGVVPEVVSGAEEARLTFAGATRSLRGVPGPVLVADVGGGSTEVVLGPPGGAPSAGLSLDVGSVRLTERHLHADPPTAGQVAAAAADVDAALGRLPGHGVDLRSARTVVAVSGTGLTVAAAALGLDGLTRELDGAVLPAARVRATCARLLAASVAERRALPFMHPLRADVIGAGALVLDRVLARTAVAQVRVSVRDLLDGIAWSAVERSP